MCSPPPIDKLRARGVLPCIGRNAESNAYYFEAYRSGVDDREWCFDVWPSERARSDFDIGSGDKTVGPAFLHLVPDDRGRLRIDTIDCNQEWSRHKGVGPALLRRAAAITHLPIVSSVKEHESEAEFRTADADSMWNGMLARVHATALPEEKRFQVIPTDEP